MEAASSSACPACDSSGARKTGAYGEYSLLRCGACGLVFSDPLAHPSAEFYEKSETYEKRGEMIGMPYLSEGLPEGDIDYKFWNFSKFFRDGIKPGGSLLDVGCAEGVFLGEAAKRGYCAVGIDINRRAIERIRAARPGLDVHACTLGEFLKGDGRTFDVITSFEVLEHLENPKEYLREAREALKSGGVLVLSLPNLDRNPDYTLAKFDNPPHHLTKWPKKAIDGFLERNGFVVERHEIADPRFSYYFKLIGLARLDILVGLRNRAFRGRKAGAGGAKAGGKEGARRIANSIAKKAVWTLATLMFFASSGLGKLTGGKPIEGPNHYIVARLRE